MTDIIRKTIKPMIEEWRLERSRTQMTLGQLIERLKQLDSSVTLCIDYPHSYQGCHSDLAFEQGDARTVGTILEEAEECLERVFGVWRKRQHTMNADSLVWIAEYGYTGDRLMSVADDGSLVTAEEDNE